MVILRFLDQNSNPQATPAQFVRGLERKHLTVVRFEFNVWRLSEEMILDLFKDRDAKAGVLPPEIRQTLSVQDVSTRIRGWKEALPSLDLLNQSAKDWGELLLQDHELHKRPIQWNENMKLLMNYDFNHSKTSFQGLNMMNGLLSAVRFIQRGYGVGTERSLFDLKLTEASLIHLEQDFHEAGQALGLLERDIWFRSR